MGFGQTGSISQLWLPTPLTGGEAASGGAQATAAAAATPPEARETSAYGGQAVQAGRGCLVSCPNSRKRARAEARGGKQIVTNRMIIMRLMLLSLALITVKTALVPPIKNAYNSKGLDELESPTDMHNSNEVTQSKDITYKSIVNSPNTNHSNHSNQSNHSN